MPPLPAARYGLGSGLAGAAATGAGVGAAALGWGWWAALKNKSVQNARKMIASRYEQQVVWKAILEEYRTFEQ